MKSKFLLLLFSGAISVSLAFAHPLRQPVELSYLREADVMWSQRIWRVINLDEKINLPLKYPLQGETKELRSLIQVLYDGVSEGSSGTIMLVSFSFNTGPACIQLRF